MSDTFFGLLIISFFSFFGLPRGLNVDSKFILKAAVIIQFDSPKGAPLLILFFNPTSSQGAKEPLKKLFCSRQTIEHGLCMGAEGALGIQGDETGQYGPCVS
jgi:hypothetical protein